MLSLCDLVQKMKQERLDASPTQLLAATTEIVGAQADRIRLGASNSSPTRGAKQQNVPIS